MKLYTVMTLVTFAVTSLAAIAITVSPPEQHGRGMGAALLAGYVLLAWITAAVNFAVFGIIALVRLNLRRDD